MQDPEFYIKGNQSQRQDAKNLLSEYIHLVKWRHSEEEVVLDIGCGSGDVTSDVLKPLLPPGTRLVGCDVSEKMVNYATQQYPDIEFMMLDIGTKKLPEKLTNAFDHVFSFHCLHWIQDHKQVMKNIYDLLKPGGDMFVYYVANLPVFDIYPKMAKKDIWKSYMPDVEKYIPPDQKEENVEKKIKKILADVGFQFSFYNYKEGEVLYPNIKSMSTSILGINPYYPDLPKELKEEYREDITREFFDLKAIKDSNVNMLEQVKLPYKYNIVYAKKPEMGF